MRESVPQQIDCAVCKTMVLQTIRFREHVCTNVNTMRGKRVPLETECNNIVLIKLRFREHAFPNVDTMRENS